MDFKEQLKSSVDIVDVVGEYVRLKKSGPQRYSGLCPFHNEKTPSFSVHAARQFYKCFGCGEGGDVFSFVQKIEGVTFYEALKTLAERHGIPMPKRSLVSDEQSKLREAVFQMHELALESYRANLRGASGEMARDYLARRGVAPAVVEQFGLGYSDRTGRGLLRVLEQRFSPAEMESLRAGTQEGRRQFLRLFPKPPDVSDPRRNGQGDRLWGARAGRGRQSEVFKLAGNADIYKEPRALQPAPGQGGHSQGGPDHPGGRVYGCDRRIGGGIQPGGGELRDLAHRAAGESSEAALGKDCGELRSGRAGSGGRGAFHKPAVAGGHVRADHDARRRSGSGRILQGARRGSLSRASERGQGVLPLAGGPRAGETRRAHHRGPHRGAEIPDARRGAHLRPAGAHDRGQRRGGLHRRGRRDGAGQLPQGGGGPAGAAHGGAQGNPARR